MLTQQQLARTYSHPSKDPWEAVELYRESQRYPDDWGAQRVASKMGVSRSEVRAWVDGDGMPDAARAVEFAEAHGWFDDGWTPATRALARLTAAVFACGSIEKQWCRPSWTPTDPLMKQTIQQDLDTLGTGWKTIQREGTKPDEIQPVEKASPLGRALHVLGCPIGYKNSISARALPSFLENAPAPVRTEWVELFVRERGTRHEGKATRTIQASRSRQYLDGIAQLVEDVTNESATASDDRVTISADAVRALGLA